MKPETHAMDNLATEATALLKSLAHPARLIICCELRDAEMSVGEIEEKLGVKQPRLSRELAKLREEGLVETRREAKAIFYRLSDAPRVRAMIDAICAVMLGKPITDQVSRKNTPPLKPNTPGGFGVFARIISPQDRSTP